MFPVRFLTLDLCRSWIEGRSGLMILSAHLILCCHSNLVLMTKLIQTLKQAGCFQRVCESCALNAS